MNFFTKTGDAKTAKTATAHQASISAKKSVSARTTTPQSFEQFQSLPILVLFGLVLSAIMYGKIGADIWANNSFVDTDDAMRLVEMRDWLAGQDWRDMHQYRLDPYMPVLMHWSRLLDPIMAAFVWAFSPFMNHDYAERAMRIFYPIALHGVCYTALLWIVRRLAGAKAMMPALVYAAVTGAVTVQFIPGHIDHHNVQMVLLLMMVGASVLAIDPQERFSKIFAALTGLLASLSLAISVENVPFIAMLLAGFGLAFVLCGGVLRRVMVGFGAGFALSSVLLYAALMPTEGFFLTHFHAACDAFSGSYVVVAMSVGVAFITLGLLPLRTIAYRLGAGATAGGLVLAVIGLYSPQCFGDPLAGVDPLVSEIWLHNVEEAISLPRLFMAKPLYASELALPVILGLLAALGLLWRAHKDKQQADQLRFLLLSLQMLIGTVGMAWQIRVCCSASALAVIPCAIVTYRLISFAETQVKLTLKLLPTFAMLLFILPNVASAAEALLSKDDNKLPEQEPFVQEAMAKFNVMTPDDKKAKAQSCDTTSVVASLNVLPRGQIVAPIDLGASIMALTPHSVLAAPFHRNNHGNRAMMDIMMADNTGAQTLLKDNKVDYVVICKTMFEHEVYTKHAPDGLAAKLVKGEVPNWLERRPVDTTLYDVFAVKL